MLLGLVLHSLIPYMLRPVPHLLWPVREPSSAWVDALYWWIHGFRIPLFFFLAGLLAAATLARRSPNEFIIRRLKRLGIPFFVGLVTIVFPCMYLVWAWGWIRAGLAEVSNIFHLRFEHGFQQDLYGMAHLWFLQYLLIFSALLWLLVRLFPRIISKLPCTPLRAGRWAAGCALVAAAAVYFDPRCITEFHNWFWPRTSEFFYHGSFFVAGVVPGAQILALSRRLWLLALTAAGASFILFLTFTAAPIAPHNSAFAIATVAYAASSILLWPGLFAALLPGTHPPRLFQPLAQAAMWLYVIHPPIVGVVQVLLYDQPLPASLKITIATLSAAVVGLLLWQLANALSARFKRNQPLPT